MRDKLLSTLSTIKTTALGGLLFLVPIIVLVIALGYLYQLAFTAYSLLKNWLPFDSATGIALLFALSIVLTVLACYFSGILAKWAIGRTFTASIEQQLTRIYPKYAVYKELLAGSLGGKMHDPALRPVLLRSGERLQLALEADRLENGCVVLYLPGAPDPWIGSVSIVPADQVLPLKATLGESLEICERMGRNSSALLSRANGNASTGAS